MPVWKRQLIGWPILLGLIFMGVWLVTGKLLTGALVILGIFAILAIFCTMIALTVFISWMFGDDNRPDTCL